MNSCEHAVSARFPWQFSYRVCTGSLFFQFHIADKFITQCLKADGRKSVGMRCIRSTCSLNVYIECCCYERQERIYKVTALNQHS